ncbi:MAG: nucleotidyl transferase AbiEii/AbiGii toxin family protein [Campylobacterota bacterium]|nr:nucleotidyl transferase AbiEii/AbiGii toxin family protein [Campylobacterota bacterium]
MDSIDYAKLYKLQDEVLKLIFSEEQEFYLTGGTCLSRFYHEKRYSDDLDFFTNNSSRFGFAAKNIKARLQEVFSLTTEVESKDFIRFEVEDLLQLDFVNDRVPRYKDVVVLENGYIIDNIENILSNKLTAVIGRDNPKDIFDIYLICHFYTFDWKEILEASLTKATFSHEDLIVRLKSFPQSLLQSINVVDMDFLHNFADEFPLIIEEINNKQIHTAFNGKQDEN